MGLQSVFLVAILGFASWAAWRGVEAFMFNRLLTPLDGEVTNPKVRAFVDGLATRNVPNYKGLWLRLKWIEERVMDASDVNADLKAELRTMLQSKGIQF